MKKPTVYLAGPIDYVENEHARSWRDEVAALGLFNVIDPMHLAAAVGTPNIQMANDALLKACDGMLVRIDTDVPSWGTPYEVALAREVYKKPLVFITNGPEMKMPLYYRDAPATYDPVLAAGLLLGMMQDGGSRPMLHSGGGISQPALPGDVGYDLCAMEKVDVLPVGHGWTKVPVGDASGQLHLAAAPGTWVTMAVRSSLALRGLMVANTVIDEGYRGPVFIFCASLIGDPIVIEKGQRVAQVLVMPAVTPPLQHRDALPASARGTNGFGSTGA